MGARDVIAVGASAGGVEALMQLAAALPPDLPAAVLVVLHVSARGSLLPDVLARSGPLKVDHAVDGEELRRGRIYIAPPDRHLVVSPDGERLQLTDEPRENRNRPAIDPLFRSVAAAFGARAVGVVLTGRLDDGADGLAYIHRAGGLTIVQDPSDAASPDMPLAALAAVRPDHVVALRDLGPLLEQVVRAGPVIDVRTDTVQDTLRMAVRALEENRDMSLRLAQRARESNHPLLVKRYEERAGEAEDGAARLRRMLMRDPAGGRDGES